MDFYQPAPGMARHREMGARWMRRAGLTVPAERVIVTSGAQHGAATVLASLAKPGDVVLTEQVTYTGMKAIASLLHLQLRGVAMDGEGIMPDALEAACRESAPRALYCMPTLQNPTARTMPLARRRADRRGRGAVRRGTDRGRRLRLPARRSHPAAHRHRTRQRLLHHQHVEEHGARAPGGIRRRAGVAGGSGGRGDSGERLAHRATARGGGERVDRAG